jgi:hypothetical protein
MQGVKIMGKAALNNGFRKDPEDVPIRLYQLEFIIEADPEHARKTVSVWAACDID